MNVAGDQVRLFQLEDVQDSLKICSRVEVVGRKMLKKERDFHHHYPAGGGVVDKNRRCHVKPDKTIIFSRSDIQKAIYIAMKKKPYSGAMW